MAEQIGLSYNDYNLSAGEDITVGGGVFFLREYINAESRLIITKGDGTLDAFGINQYINVDSSTNIGFYIYAVGYKLHIKNNASSNRRISVFSIMIEST